MILDINYKNGHGHMKVDLDSFLPTSLSQWRKLVALMREDKRESVREYLYQRHDKAKEGIAKNEVSYAFNSAGYVSQKNQAERLRAQRKLVKKGTEAYADLSERIKAADAAAKAAYARLREAVTQGKKLKQFVDKYPDYIRLLWE